MTISSNKRENSRPEEASTFAHALFPEMSWFPETLYDQECYSLPNEKEESDKKIDWSPIMPCKWCDSHYPFSNGILPKNAEESIKPDSIDIVFVGEPSRDELTEDGTPTEMRESETDLLSKMIKSIGLPSERVTRGFLVKCAKESNHTLSPTCLSNFWKEIYRLRPKIILSLGAVTTNILLHKQERISKIHGRFFSETVKFQNRDNLDIQIVPIFHPNYLLINPDMKRSVWTDLQKVMAYFNKEKKNSP